MKILNKISTFSRKTIALFIIKCYTLREYFYTNIYNTKRSKGGTIVKTYITPEMKVKAFVAEEAINAPLDGSKLFNDGELEW